MQEEFCPYDDKYTADFTLALFHYIRYALYINSCMSNLNIKFCYNSLELFVIFQATYTMLVSTTGNIKSK